MIAKEGSLAALFLIRLLTVNFWWGGDWQGLPDVEMLDALQGYTLLRTDRNGWIEISTDGELMWVAFGRR